MYRFSKCKRAILPFPWWLLKRDPILSWGEEEEEEEKEEEEEEEEEKSGWMNERCAKNVTEEIGPPPDGSRR